MPYSDPVMDGPTIQAAAEQALTGGFRLRDLFDVVESVSSARRAGRGHDVLEPGAHATASTAFARDLAAAGGLGMITPDLVPDEAPDWLAASDGARPGPDLPGGAVLDRGAAGADRAPRRPGFLYATAVMGVTGARDEVGGRGRAGGAGSRAHRRPADRRSGSACGRGTRPPRSPGSRTASIVGSAFVSRAGDEAAVRELAAELAEGVRRPLVTR